MARTKTPTKQGDYEVGNKKPPKNRQFGQPEGNPRHNGAWKKEDTLRYKLQQIAKMTAEELEDFVSNPEVSAFEINAARTILQMSDLDPQKRWVVLEGMINQDSGFPRQQVEQTNIEAPPSLSPRPVKTKPKEKK